MISVDTNVILRHLLNDNPVQSPVASKFLTDENILILPTVILEVVHVLAMLYGYTPREIRKALTTLLGAPNVHMQNYSAIHDALYAYAEGGMDFPDAYHICLSEGTADEFATFERLKAKADRLDLKPPVRFLKK